MTSGLGVSTVIILWPSPLWKEVDQVRQCGLVGGQRTREKVKLLCITKGQEFEGGRIERREEEKSE